jgi:hypothetical protein
MTIIKKMLANTGLSMIFFIMLFASGGQKPFEKGFWIPKTFHERFAFKQ